ncbi:MAG: hypothetical protein AABO58_04940 [Acidobacteriota bacterium]
MFNAREVSLTNDEGPILGSGWIHMGSTLLLVVSWFFGFKLLKSDPRLAGALLIGGAIPAALTILQFVRLRRALGKAELQMKEEPVPLGWSGNVTYVRPLRGATVRSIEARLQCEEYATKGRGKRRKEWREVVLDEPLTPQSAPMLEQLRVQIPLRIPPTAPPTMWENEAQIVWFVRLRLRMAGCPDTRSSFRVQVAPAVVER